MYIATASAMQRKNPPQRLEHSGQFHDIICSSYTTEIAMSIQFFTIVGNSDETPATATWVSETRSISVHLHVIRNIYKTS
jgi:hypothetical protein